MTERDRIEYGGPLLILVAELCEADETDIREVLVKLDGMRAVLNEYQAHVEQAADELALRDEPLTGRCPDMDWFR